MNIGKPQKVHTDVPGVIRIPMPKPNPIPVEIPARREKVTVVSTPKKQGEK